VDVILPEKKGNKRSSMNFRFHSEEKEVTVRGVVVVDVVAVESQKSALTGEMTR
jgi:hypothetical protein